MFEWLVFWFFEMYIGKLQRYFFKKIKTDFNGEEFNFRIRTSELVFLSTKKLTFHFWTGLPEKKSLNSHVPKAEFGCLYENII